jgi:hypothetical protein
MRELYWGDIISRIDSFVLNPNKRKLLQEMADKVDTQYHDCCPVLEDCIEQVHSCYLPEYSGSCYYKKVKKWYALNVLKVPI